MDYSDLSFVLRGKRRKLILFALDNKAKTITDLKNELKLNLSNVSNTVKKLERKLIIDCKNSDDYHYKFYGLIKKGKVVREDILSYEKS